MRLPGGREIPDTTRIVPMLPFCYEYAIYADHDQSCLESKLVICRYHVPLQCAAVIPHTCIRTAIKF